MIIDVLSNLSSEEILLMNQVERTIGSIEDKIKQLNELGTFVNYQKIYERYNDYYQTSRDLETFKRIVFLQWYAALEPAAFTGINELNDVVQRANLMTLKAILTDGLLDREFSLMLVHYYSVSSWYFDAVTDFSNIFPLSVQFKNLRLIKDFKNRGQMGKYWESLNSV